MSLYSLSIKPGDRIQRREIHSALGGQTQSGISPSSRSPVILLFSNPSGEEHGYFDGWHPDGCFHYSGEGQRGDQIMQRGNKAIRDHSADHRELHLFLGDGKGRPVTYVGHFELADYYSDDAPETGGGPLRRVYMFRLRPVTDSVGNEPRRDLGPAVRPDHPEDTAVVDDVPPEEHQTERYVLDRTSEPTEAERRESKLVQDYLKYQRSNGHEITRKRITISGEAKQMFTDLFDGTDNVLIEAKGSVTREAVRMAIGQLLDYRRWIETAPDLAVLLPECPRPDLQALLAANNIRLLFPSHEGFGFTEVAQAAQQTNRSLQ